MKQFWKDYGELCKETGRFYKKHWKGVILLEAVIVGAGVAWFRYNSREMENLIASSEKKEGAQ